MVKLTYDNGSVQGVLDTWNYIHSSLDGNPLFLSTTDRQSIPFNREIFCSLSPYISRLVKETFESGCCCSNHDVIISLPEEVSSKTVYDLKSLMIGGTISGMDGQGVKELKSLFSILGFKSIIIKDESNDDDCIVVQHEFRTEDAIEEEGSEDGGRNDEANSENDNRSIGIKTGGGEVVNGAREIDTNGTNVMNDKPAAKVTSQDFPITTGTTNETFIEAENTNSYEELGGGSTPLEYSGPAQNDEEHAKNDERSVNIETGRGEAVSDENEENNEAGEIGDKEDENYEKYMNCEVKLEKLKESFIEDGGMGIKTRLRKKKDSIKRASRSDSDDSDVSFNMEGMDPARKRPKRSKKEHSYKNDLYIMDDSSYNSDH